MLKKQQTTENNYDWQILLCKIADAQMFSSQRPTHYATSLNYRSKF